MSWNAIVFYLCPSTDGVFAALSFDFFAKRRFMKTTYVPVKNTYRLFDRIDATKEDSHTECFFLSCTPFISEIDKFTNRYNFIRVIDHHPEAVQRFTEYCNNPKNDMRKIGNHCALCHSSCMITLKTFANDYERSKLMWVCELYNKIYPCFQQVQEYTLNKLVGSDNDHLFVAGLDSKNFYQRYDIRKNPSIFDELKALNFDEVCEWGRLFLMEKTRKINNYLTQIRIGKSCYDLTIFLVKVNSDDYYLVEELGEMILYKPNARLGHTRIVVLYMDNSEEPEKYSVKLFCTAWNKIVKHFVEKLGAKGGPKKFISQCEKNIFETLFINKSA